jgi:hypothetical protein
MDFVLKCILLELSLETYVYWNRFMYGAGRRVKYRTAHDMIFSYTVKGWRGGAH